MKNSKRSSLLYLVRCGSFGANESEILRADEAKEASRNLLYSWILVAVLAVVVCLHTSIFF